MKSLIFSAPMVKALLAGKKTMTRRPVKPQPTFGRWKNHKFSQEITYGMLDHAPYTPGDVLYVRETWANLGWDNYIYQADEFNRYGHYQHWRPSIRMPREAARIFLKVTSVRAERLQDISEADAEAEGVTTDLPTGLKYENHIAAFAQIWSEIYAKKPEFGWDADPWVFVISFERNSA